MLHLLASFNCVFEKRIKSILLSRQLLLTEAIFGNRKLLE